MQDIPDNLIRRAAQGDTAAFKEIYDISAGYVLNVVFRITGNREDAEEVVQDVFIAVYRKLGGFRFDASFKTWLYRIAVNTALNRVKKTNKERNRRAEFREDLAVFGTVDQRTVIDREFNESLVRNFFEALNPDQRACLVLRSVEKLSYQEISRTLKININTVRTRIKRAREALLAIRKEVVNNAMR